MKKQIDYSKKGNPKICVGEKGKKESEFHWPRGLAIDHNSNNIFVSERDLEKIRVYNEKGEYLYQIRTLIPRNFYLCITNNLIYTSNFYNHTLSIYNLMGDFITTFGGSGTDLGKFGFPQGLSIDEELNKLFICDRDNSRVQIFGDSYTRAITSTEKAQLTIPRDVKYRSQKLYVMDIGEKYIHIYDPFYPYPRLRSVIEFDQSRKPYYFELDWHLNILLSNYAPSSIEVYNNEGELIHTLATKGSLPGNVISPNGIAITKYGDIVTISVDKSSGMLQVL